MRALDRLVERHCRRVELVHPRPVRTVLHLVPGPVTVARATSAPTPKTR